VEGTVLVRFQQGDPDAVRAVYRQYGRLVHAVAYRTLGNRDLADEATQQTFVQAWRAAASFDTARELGPWLATIARRVAIDLHRHHARRPAGALDDVAPSHPAVVSLPPSLDQVFEVWQVREAVDTLPPDEREVVRLQHSEGLTHAAIAEHLGVPIGTVKSRSFRAHKRLAAQLAHLRGDA
jgi:RNA polymerase sigma factor (sigma-70 family)